MQHTSVKIGRVVLGVLCLFVAWFLGGYVGNAICPNSAVVGGMEAIAAKAGSSVAIFVAALIIRRHLLRSFGLALACLVATEVTVLLIVICFSGLTTLTMTDVRFNAWWLYALTWNVVIAFLIGTVAGQFWDNWATKAAGLQNRPGVMNSPMP
jgi:hypothetical protein